MKDLIRLTGYSIAAVAMIALIIGVSGSGTGPYLALLIVVVLPIVIGIFMVRREKRDT